MNRKDGQSSALDIGCGCRCTDAGCDQGRQDTKHDRESSGHLPNGASINICPDSLFEAAQVRMPPEIAESPQAMAEIFHDILPEVRWPPTFASYTHQQPLSLECTAHCRPRQQWSVRYEIDFPPRWGVLDPSQVERPGPG